MRTAQEAAKAFRERSTNRVGMCLWHVQDSYQSPHLYPSAIEQWRQAHQKHPGDRTPPVGAPVYFAGGRFGHIAIYVGDGRVRSTDSGGAGRMATTSIDWFRTHWGYSYLGWTGDIGGRAIDYARHVDVHYNRLKPGVDDSDSVRFLRRCLIRRGFLDVSPPLKASHPGNRYTPAVERAVARWQKRKGHAATGVLTKVQAREFFSVNPKVKLHF